MTYGAAGRQKCALSTYATVLGSGVMLGLDQLRAYVPSAHFWRPRLRRVRH